jgi:hypothetical protein
MESKPWPDVDSLALSPHKELAREIVDLNLNEGEINGNVVVVGAGSGMLEKIFTHDLTTGFRRLREGVRSVSCFTTEHFRHSYFEHPVEVVSPMEALNPERGNMYLCTTTVQRGARILPGESIRAAFFLREVHLSDQLAEVAGDLFPALTPEGLLIASGGGFESEEEIERITGSSYLVREVSQIPNYGGFPYRRKHMAMVLEKRIGE